MKIISWNVNGLRAVHKKGLFLPMIEKYQPDIICLQEIKLGKDPARLASESVAGGQCRPKGDRPVGEISPAPVAAL